MQHDLAVGADVLEGPSSVGVRGRATVGGEDAVGRRFRRPVLDMLLMLTYATYGACVCVCVCVSVCVCVWVGGCLSL